MSSRFKDWMIDNRWPLALAAATLATRAVYLASVVHDPFFGYLRHIPDAFFFNNWAQGIASGDWWGGDDVFFIGPLYAYFLGIIYRLIGPQLTVVRVIHIALEIGSALFIYGFARRAVGERAAKVAGVIWVLYLPAIFFSSFVLPVSLDVFLITGSFYLLARGVKGRRWNFAGAGALLGLAVLDRTNVLIFVAAAVPLFLVYVKRLGWRRIVAYFAPIAAIVLAVTLRNGVVGGDIVLVSSQGGLNFYLGNSPTATGVYWNLGEVYQGRPAELNKDLATLIAREVEGRDMKPSEVSRWWMSNGLAWLRDNPGDAARLYWRKMRYFFNDYEVSLNVDFYFIKFISPFHRVQIPWFGFVFPFSVIGLAAGWRKSPFARTAGALFVVMYALSVLVFFVSARYRLPMVPILIVFAGAGLVLWYDLWRRWRWRSAAALTVAAVVLGACVMWPPAGLRRDGAFGQSYYRYGKFYFDQGEYEKTVTYLKKATELTPEMYQGFTMLGMAYENLGQLDTALEVFWRGTIVAPNKADMHYNFAIALVRGGNLGQALPSLHRAVELEPSYAAAWMQLAEVYIGLGDYRRADLAYRRVVELSPGDGSALYRYAELQLQMGRVAEALTYAQAAVEADPNLPGPGFILGRVYYHNDDYLAALKYFEREVGLQPTSSEVFGFLAASYGKLGEVERGRAAYRDYLSLGGARDPAFERDAGISSE
ncbi:MAG: tetratricopeptide repeat protein [bacterium]